MFQTCEGNAASADFPSDAQALRGKAESIRAGELEKALSKVGEGLTKKQLKAIEELSRGIVNKILHGPMTALRCDGSDPDAVGQTLANMEALERMFELSRFETPVSR
jgi:glutamyl-tRNA reductase